MKFLLSALLACLVLTPLVALPYNAGWRIDALRPDGKGVLDRPAPTELDFAEMTAQLSAQPKPSYAVTLKDDRKIVVSKSKLHRDICAHLQVNEHHALRQQPYTQRALFGLLSRRRVIEITLTRPKNSFNPLFLLVIMSNPSKDSIDPFVIAGEPVVETLRLNPDDSCEDVTPRPEPAPEPVPAQN